MRLLRDALRGAGEHHDKMALRGVLRGKASCLADLLAGKRLAKNDDRGTFSTNRRLEFRKIPGCVAPAAQRHQHPLARQQKQVIAAVAQRRRPLRSPIRAINL